jgi:hypothetical protein
MSSKSASAVVNKFTVSGVLLIAAGVAFAVLANVVKDASIITMVALPVALLGAAMFYRNHLDHRPTN